MRLSNGQMYCASGTWQHFGWIDDDVLDPTCEAIYSGLHGAILLRLVCKSHSRCVAATTR